ncbi:hypothetical protein H4R22_003907 [Coemansia sp. RSA 1290]|nr:hypothetical protein H4R22_003907 [Coemansia sp. RSA 1290]KAJ2651645.1 hypothetical protein IWW40_001545 [Coemansia sp. RSA 1250]
MDGANPAATAIIERVIPYLDKRSTTVCKELNKTWYTLITLESVRNIDCHVLQLPLRIAEYRRRGLLSMARSLTVDISFIEGFLSPPMYERRVLDAATLLATSPMPVRYLKIHAPGLHSTLSNEELHHGTYALDRLLRALPRVSTLDLSDCPVSLLATASGFSPLAELTQLRRIHWFAMGRNDLSSAAMLAHLVAQNLPTLTTLDGKSDINDRILHMLCDAPGFIRLNASGSDISDDALLELMQARGLELKELVLSDCTRLTRRSITRMTPTLLPKLASLDLYNVMVTTDTYQCLFNSQSCWPYLRDLKLKAAIPHISPQQDSLVNDDILEAIGKNCPRLVSLRLFGCHGITDDGLSSILGNLGYLRELVVMHHSQDPVSEEAADPPQPSNGLLLSLPSINDIWAGIPSLPNNALPQQTTRPRAHAPTSAPDTPCLTQLSHGQRFFTSQALRRGVRSQRFNLLNLDMAYDSVCAEHLAKLSHLHVLCGRMITRHAKSLIESQFPKCKMMVWNID